MGKNFETKKAILESLVAHKRTLTDLSRLLSLSPSTIKQHLEELQNMGLVQFVNDVHLHKFKYYERVTVFDTPKRVVEIPRPIQEAISSKYRYRHMSLYQA